MAVIGARELQPVNVLGSYIQGRELGRQATAQRREEAALDAAARQQAELRNFLSTADLSSPETQNQLMRFGKPGIDLVASMTDIAGKRATAEKTGLESAALKAKTIDDNYGRFQKMIGDFAYGDVEPTKAQVLDKVDFMIEQGTIAPQFRDYAVNTLSDDPVQLQAQLRSQFLAQVPPAERARLFMTTAGERLTARTAERGQDITMRGQDITAATAREGQQVTMRGQDITAETARRGQEITMRGQDMNAFIQSPEHQGALTAARERAKSDVTFGDQFNSAQTTAQRTLALLDTIVGDAQIIDGKIAVKAGGREPMKGFKGAVGAPIIPGERFIPGTAARDFVASHDQAVGAAFMQAFATLKGGGQITEKEGEKATAALTRMNLAQSEVEYIKAAREFQGEVKKVLKIAEERYSKINPFFRPAATPGSKTTSSGTTYEIVED
jgi:hypothetical protein